MNGRQKGYLNKAHCASAYCPTLAAIASRMMDERPDIDISRIPLSLPKDEMHQDSTGAYWCATCKPRYDLMDYGARHAYPAADFPPYAVAHGQSFWRLLCGIGKPECIAAWAAALELDEHEEAV